MVKVWVFSGGGEAEYRGLKHFLDAHFPTLEFIRMFPARPGKRPKKKLRRQIETIPVKQTEQGGKDFGATGQYLLTRTKKRLEHLAVQGEIADLAFTLDDLDCRDPTSVKKSFEDMFRRFKTRFPSLAGLGQIHALASPELEAWLVANWDDSFGKHPELREKHVVVKRSLQKMFPGMTTDPEQFSSFDPLRNCCVDKLSEALINAYLQHGVVFRKSLHTPALLQMIQPAKVSKTCPLFREFFNQLKSYE